MRTTLQMLASGLHSFSLPLHRATCAALPSLCLLAFFVASSTALRVLLNILVEFFLRTTAKGTLLCTRCSALSSISTGLVDEARHSLRHNFTTSQLHTHTRRSPTWWRRLIVFGISNSIIHKFVIHPTEILILPPYRPLYPAGNNVPKFVHRCKPYRRPSSRGDDVDNHIYSVEQQEKSPQPKHN